MDTEIQTELFIPYRKHSSGDLQSRLKTRKILGVGETDNGDIHRSKISQVLGHNDHLYVKFPRCYVLWHLILAAFYTGTGILNIMIPKAENGTPVTNDGDSMDSDVLPTKLYGSAVLGFGLLLWMQWRTADKSLARSLMTAVVISELLHLGVLGFEARNEDLCENYVHNLIHTLVATGSAYFVWAIGSSTAGMRKSPSYKDLSMISNDESAENDDLEPDKMSPKKND